LYFVPGQVFYGTIAYLRDRFVGVFCAFFVRRFTSNQHRVQSFGLNERRITVQYNHITPLKPAKRIFGLLDC
jgi:hypothetical protein